MLAPVNDPHRLTLASFDLPRPNQLHIAGDSKRALNLEAQSFFKLYQMLLISVDVGPRLHEHIQFVHVVGTTIDDDLIVRLDLAQLQQNSLDL